MSYVDVAVWTCPYPECTVTVRGDSEARRATRRACARRHGTPVDDGRTAAEVSPALADRAIPRAPKRPRRGPQKRR